MNIYSSCEARLQLLAWKRKMYIKKKAGKKKSIKQKKKEMKHYTGIPGPFHLSYWFLNWLTVSALIVGCW